MDTKKIDVTKQVYLLLGLIVFAFLNVFLFDQKEGIGFSVFSTLSLLTIGLLSKHSVLRVLGVISYIINIVASLLSLNYLGWLTAVQAIGLIFMVWYVYPQDQFLKTNTTDKFVYRFRWQQLFLTGAIATGIYLVFLIVSALWDNSFLEYGGNTALIFGMQYFLYTSLAKSRANEADFVANLQEATKVLERVRQNTVDYPAYLVKKPTLPSLATDNYIKMAAIWLVVMDLSILSYLIHPNNIGFGIGAFFVLLSIVISLCVKTVENKADVFSVIYHKLRPIQPIFFIILLLANAHQFSYGVAYALLFALAYFIWAINKINMKTFLTITILIYFLPVFGYISNPFRLGAANVSEAVKMVVVRGETDYFHLESWWNLSPDTWEEEGQSYDDYEKEVRQFSEELFLTGDLTSDYSGILIGEAYDLTIKRDKGVISIRSHEDFDEVLLANFPKIFEDSKNLNSKENEVKDENFYYIDTIDSLYGRYKIYLEMDDEWVKTYEADPTRVDYHIWILGSDEAPDTYL